MLITDNMGVIKDVRDNKAKALIETGKWFNLDEVKQERAKVLADAKKGNKDAVKLSEKRKILIPAVTKQDNDAKALKDAEDKAKAEADAKAKAEAEAKLKAEADAKAKEGETK